jgi:hypothetical protein
MNTSDNLANVTSSNRDWSIAGKVSFRFAFSYFIFYLFCNGNITVFTPIDRIAWVGGSVSHWLWLPLSTVALKLGSKFFHLTGVAATWHGGGSGDTALDWILEALFIGVAIVATVIWSILDRKRAAYPVLYAWLRFIIRLMLGVSMIAYGFAKVFPTQMQATSLGVLNEPFGQVSPMSMLWSMLGTFPAYEMICGWAEVLAGVLLLVRRTSLAGALLSAFVMSNVLLYNMFFDVPVKLFAAHLVLLALFVMLPDVEPLLRFFVLNKPAEAKGVWVPPSSRPGYVKATKIVEVGYLIFVMIALVNFAHTRWTVIEASRGPSPLLGAWTVSAASPLPMKSPEGLAWTNIYFDNTSRAMVRDTSGQLWRYPLQYNAAKSTVGMRSAIDQTIFKWKVNDPDHLTLISVAKSTLSDEGRTTTQVQNVPDVLQLERQPTAKSYVLYQRGFHWVSEWGYER